MNLHTLERWPKRITPGAFTEFEIKSYKLQLIADCFGSPDARYQITVKSEVMTHDIQYTAKIGFLDGNAYADKNRVYQRILVINSISNSRNLLISPTA
jgi:hypothetical protein